MFVLRQFLLAAAWLVDYLLWAYMWVIIVRALLSWVNPDPWNPIVRFLVQVTEPVLRPVRRWLFRWLPETGFDISPVVVILAIIFIQQFLVPVLRESAIRLG